MRTLGRLAISRSTHSRMSAGRGARLDGLVVALVLVGALSTAGASSAAEVKTLDFSEGSYSGVLFVYFTPPPVEGEARIALGVTRLLESPLSQAMECVMSDGTWQTGATEETLASDLKSDDQSGLEIEVHFRAFDVVRHMIHEGATQAGENVDGMRHCENVLDKVFREVGLKLPYRSPLGGGSPNPILYLYDLTRLNR